MVVIAFYSDKGGVGKTTLTMNFAVTAKERLGLNVAILDTVTGYRSLSEDRKRDLEKYSHLDIQEDDIVKIIISDDYQEDDGYKEFLRICKDAEYDILLIDLPTVNGINLPYILKCDYIFIVSDGLENLEQDFKTYSAMSDTIGESKEFNIKDVFVVFNKIEREQVKELNNKVMNMNIVEPIICYDLRYKKLNTLKIELSKEMIELTNNILNKIDFYGKWKENEK
jgi:MinD-like ATPase involved in chromosome partitioning or flagellar assembly